MKITLSNRQKIASPRRAPLRRLLRRLMALAQRRDPGRAWTELTVILTDDPGSQAANRACFGHDYATDVITQAYAPMPGDDGWTGDIVVNVQRACQAGAGARRQYELALFLAHGCDHLTGGMDDTPVRRRQMIRREGRWLRATRWRELTPFCGSPL